MTLIPLSVPKPWRRWLVTGAAALAALVIAFVAGRYSAPVKVTEREKVIERTVRDEAAIASAVASARASWQRDVQDHTITRTIYREGKPVERIVYVDRDTHSGGSSEATSSSQLQVTAHEEAQRTTEREKITESGRPGWSVGVGGLWNPGRLSARPERYDLELGRRLFGTVWIAARVEADGVTDLKRARVGAALRLEF